MSRNKKPLGRINQVYSGVFFTQVSFLIIKSIFILCLAKYFTLSVLQMSNIFHFSEFFGSVISFLIILASLKSNHKKIISIIICCILPACYFDMPQNFESFKIVTAVGSFILIMSLASALTHISKMIMEAACKDGIANGGLEPTAFVKNNTGMFFVYAAVLFLFPFFFRQSDSLREITAFCISTSVLSLLSFMFMRSDYFAYKEDSSTHAPFINANVTLRIIYTILIFLFTAPLIAIVRQSWTLWYYQSFHLIRDIGSHKIFPEQMFGVNAFFVAILYPFVSKMIRNRKLSNTTQLIWGSLSILLAAFLICAIHRKLILSGGNVSILLHILPRFFVAIGELLLGFAIISLFRDLTGFDPDVSGLMLAIQVVFSCLVNIILINITKSKIGAWADFSFIIAAVCACCVFVVSLLISRTRKGLLASNDLEYLEDAEGEIPS